MHNQFTVTGVACLSLYGKTEIENNMICVAQGLHCHVLAVAGNRLSLEENNFLCNRKGRKRG